MHRRIEHLSLEQIEYMSSRLGLDNKDFTLYSPNREDTFARVRRDLGLKNLIQAIEDVLA